MQLMRYKAALAAAGLAATLGLTVTAVAQKAPTAKPKSVAVPKVIPGFDASAMDTSANPCDNFYQFACGNYAKLHPIPNDLPEYDQFVSLYEFNTAALHRLVVQAAHAGPNRSANQQKIGDYYQACMDTSQINKDGTAPLKPMLDRINDLTSKKQLPALLADLNNQDVTAFVNFGSQQDLKDASKEIAVIDQGGLGLPNRGYYFRKDARSVKLREQYVQHIANVLHLLGDSDAQAQSEAKNIMQLETNLAQSSMGIVERRDPHKTYHIETVKAFAPTVPVLNMPEFLKAIGAPPVSSLNVAVPGFFTALNKTIQDTPLSTIKNYLRFHLADSYASRLPEQFDQENFAFYGRDLTGTPQQQPRWKRCVNSTDSALGDALGQLYVAKYFTPSQKKEALTMVHGIEAAMGKDIEQSDWMSAATKQKALQKLHMIADKIGYPNKWRSYAKLTIKPDDALGNSMRARVFESAYQLNKIGKPVDRNEWFMTPPTVNAYYDPSQNTINFPAGILQPPFYDKNEPAAVNYGHIGAVVGHELTHGFDDQGSQFDGKGNLDDWWTPQDKKNFNERTACIANEYSSFTDAGLHVNGKLTLGEDTADNGGVHLALMALMARQAMDGGHISGPAATGMAAKYTPEQQFFIAFAQNWCSNMRPQMTRMLIQSDPHAPDAIRVKGVLDNMPQFDKAFSCHVGQPMDAAKKCSVW
ncbi:MULTISPECIES: M13 family metallopeptidase [Acidobacterium]|uniref:Peptidase, M13 (Neprilysin) family n=1 Tax=Acidobacterium capsulatum (strain ATCC 51196 / DSM 11244 / BCRC 80197 / JCM 7670 / NBRC 15755 / NCIMB 13165 / 161) TaxID=240015 RepID=C1FA99_ACIC5|nr:MULTISPECIES: M13 family metallopeptidase [Acidobacterium]ACO34104.1 peptidase, M13 (neprilysin) family [Acidobacterium capsulatum ATCC 51196]